MPSSPPSGGRTDAGGKTFGTFTTSGSFHFLTSKNCGDAFVLEYTAPLSAIAVVALVGGIPLTLDAAPPVRLGW